MDGAATGHVKEWHSEWLLNRQQWPHRRTEDHPKLKMDRG
jgi:hypothetical protein